MTESQILQAVVNIAKQSQCHKAHCGSIIINNGVIIGEGYNSPAGSEPNRCNDDYTLPEQNKHDVTCCVHAEVRAIHDAMNKHAQELAGSQLYFMRVDDQGQPTSAGTPYCTICSKEALDAKIAQFGLWRNGQFQMYNTQEYNDLSYQYYKDSSLWALK